jgi:hypothetical protein
MVSNSSVSFHTAKKSRIWSIYREVYHNCVTKLKLNKYSYRLLFHKALWKRIKINGTVCKRHHFTAYKDISFAER